jgi:hypothetical protein
MQKMWLDPAGVIIAILLLVFVIGTALLMMGYSLDPTKQVAVGVGLVIIFLILGLMIYDLLAKNSKLPEVDNLQSQISDLQTKNSKLEIQNEKLTQAVVDWVRKKLKALGDMPTVNELDIPVRRWLEVDSPNIEVIYERVRSMLQICIKIKNEIEEITFIKSFSVYKPERGVFLVRLGNEPIPKILKLDYAEDIRNEYDRFRRCINLIGANAPRLLWPSDESDIETLSASLGVAIYGLAAYNWTASDKLRTFSQYYGEKDTGAVVRILEKIIQDVMVPWWASTGYGCPRKRENPQEKSLYYEYQRRLKEKLLEEERSKVEKVLKEIRKLVPNITITEQGIDLKDMKFHGGQSLPNPLNWVERIFENEGSFKGEYSDLDDPNARRDSIVHGDFHAGNILVEEFSSDAIIWLIDFPHTHVGPTVQDIARLEADIKFGLFPKELLNKPNFDRILVFEEAILTADNRQELDLLDGLLDKKRDKKSPSLIELDKAWHKWVDNHEIESISPELDSEMAKVWQALAILRSRMRKRYFGSMDDPRPYYLALLHATLPTLYYDNRSCWQKLYAFISAALLCERLGG